MYVFSLVIFSNSLGKIGIFYIMILKLRKIVKLHFMLAKAGTHYAKINEKMDSHFRGNDKPGSFFC